MKNKKSRFQQIKNIEKPKKKEIVCQSIIDSSKLYQSLTDLRRNLAKTNKCPAYIIFPNKTLREMAEIQPKTTEELLGINGVGKIKCQKYGKQFIKVIKNQ